MGLFTRKVVEVKDAVAGRNGFGKPTQYAFGKRRTPEGGANPYAFETLQLPMYTPIGWGVANKADFRSTMSAPVVHIAQGVPPDSLGNPGILSGQFVSQPLLSATTRNPGQLDVLANYNPQRNIIREGQS